jgi:hypothetical protein
MRFIVISATKNQQKNGGENMNEDSIKKMHEESNELFSIFLRLPEEMQDKLLDVARLSEIIAERRNQKQQTA